VQQIESSRQIYTELYGKSPCKIEGLQKNPHHTASQHAGPQCSLLHDLFGNKSIYVYQVEVVEFRLVGLRRVQSGVTELNWHDLVFDKLTNGQAVMQSSDTV